MARLNCVTVLAPAKLNLALDVVGLLPGGYHDLDMTMQAITLYERVVLRRSPYLNLRLPGSLVAPNNKNTAIKAALAFFHYTGLLAGVDITIYKNTPVRALAQMCPLPSWAAPAGCRAWATCSSPCRRCRTAGSRW